MDVTNEGKPMIGAAFDSTKTHLQDLLVGAASGKIQLPDFQRGWVWDDDHIRSLLTSVSVSIPIGAVMMLQIGGESVLFKPRPLSGTDPRLCDIAPESLILDGLQRLTSLHQALIRHRFKPYPAYKDSGVEWLGEIPAHPSD